MKQFKFFLLVSLILASFCLSKAPSAPASEPGVNPSGGQRQTASAGKWLSLFNGKDLSGWFVDGGDEKNIRVVDGMIVASGSSWRTRSYLLTKESYSNFILRLEFKPEKNSGGGIALRAIAGEHLPQGRALFFDHPILKLLDAPSGNEETGTMHWLRNGLYAQPDRHADLAAPGSWNQLEVELRGRYSKVTVNKTVIAETTLADGAMLPGGIVPGLNRVKGPVGIQKHHGTISYRNIEIMELPPADMPANVPPPPTPTAAPRATSPAPQMAGSAAPPTSASPAPHEGVKAPVVNAVTPAASPTTSPAAAIVPQPPAAAPGMLPSRLQTIGISIQDFRFLAIGQDGNLYAGLVRLSLKTPDNAPQHFEVSPFEKLADFAGSVNLGGDTAYVQSFDGSWRVMAGADRVGAEVPVRPPILSTDHVVSIAGGNDPMFWVCFANGTVYLPLSGLNGIPRPGSKLDKVVKVCGAIGQANHVTMLRSDGTVWVDDCNLGQNLLTTEGARCARPIRGLDHIKSLSVFSPYPVSDTGAAIQDDGSVVYWGTPSIEDFGNGLPPIETPSIKRLSKPAKAIAVAAGMSCAAAVDPDGHVWVWGIIPLDYGHADNGYVACLRGATTPAKLEDADVAVKIDGLNDIGDVQIFNSRLTGIIAFALSKDGNVWAWSSEVAPVKIFEGVRLPTQLKLPTSPVPFAMLLKPTLKASLFGRP